MIPVSLIAGVLALYGCTHIGQLHCGNLWHISVCATYKRVSFYFLPQRYFHSPEAHTTLSRSMCGCSAWWHWSWCMVTHPSWTCRICGLSLATCLCTVEKAEMVVNSDWWWWCGIRDLFCILECTCNVLYLPLIIHSDFAISFDQCDNNVLTIYQYSVADYANYQYFISNLTWELGNLW